jgi:hypothetical protein
MLQTNQVETNINQVRIAQQGPQKLKATSVAFFVGV